jgi:hypothetical protein
LRAPEHLKKAGVAKSAQPAHKGRGRALSDELQAAEKLNFQTIPMHGNRRSIGCDDLRDEIVSNLVVVTGPYRGGTTLLVDFMNARQDACVASDFLEREHTSLFYFAGQTGVGAYLGLPELSSYTACGIIKNGIFDGDHIVGLTKVIGQGFKNERFTYRDDKRYVISDLDRYTSLIPEFHRRGVRLVLKHPELSFNFPELGKLLPKARFLLTYRPFMYVVRSWVRATSNKPGTWADLFKVWLDREGKFALPVNLPREYKEPWQEYSTFQRIVCFNHALYTKYLENVQTWDKNRFLLLHHQNLAEHPDLHRKEICAFLEMSNRDRGMFEFQKKFLRNRNREITFTPEQHAQAREVLGRGMAEEQEMFEEAFTAELTVRPPEKKAAPVERTMPRTLATPPGFFG